MAAYDVQQVGDATEFSTTPEIVPVPWMLIGIPGAFLVLIGLSMSIIGGIIAGGFCYGVMHLLMHSKQATLSRTPSRFRVTSSGIEINGTTIPKDSIHRIIIRNHVLKNAESLIVVANPNPYSGQQNVVAGMNWAITKLGPISYRVDVEARGTPTTLAGGLTEPTASAIVMDINKIMQMAKAA